MIQELATCLGSLLGTVVASSTLGDVYVDLQAPNCAMGAGTQSDPVCSISVAIGLAVPGDTIHIAPGVYLENLVIDKDLQLVGTAGAGETIVQDGQSDTVIEILASPNVFIDGLSISDGRKSGVIATGNLTIRNSTFVRNLAEIGYYSRGGGVVATSGAGSLTVEYSKFVRNYSDCDGYCGGGAIEVEGIDLTILGSQFEFNSSWDTSGYGTTNGGAIRCRSSKVTIANSTFSRNDVLRGDGGAIYAHDCELIISNSTISGNEGFVGGLYSSATRPGSRLSHTTITGNSSGGIRVRYNGHPLSVENSIVAGNLDFGFPRDADGSLVTLGHNLVGNGGAWITDGVNGDHAGSFMDPKLPLLTGLRDHGGPSRTHALLLGSPALDSANPATALSTDQRGVARAFGLGPDIGAHEFNATGFNVCNGDGGDQFGCTDCPCANNAAEGTIGGCLNSTGFATRLHASGDPTVAASAMSIRDLRFSVSSAPASALCVLLSGNAVASINVANPCVGLMSGVRFEEYDGLRCAVQALRRHGARSANTAGVTTSPWGGEGPPSVGIAQAFGGFTSGQTRYFQVVHRDDALASCQTGLNSTQAIEVQFTP